jgi:hypothetical protein
VDCRRKEVVRKTLLSEPFLHFKTIVLPRQARDKHNETLTNERRYVFCRRANATDAPENYYEWQARSQVSTWWPVAPSDEDKQTKNYTSGPPLDGCALHLPPAAHPHTHHHHLATHTLTQKKTHLDFRAFLYMVSRAAAAVPLLCYALATTMQQQRRRRRRRHARRREQALEWPDWRLLQGPRAVLRRSGEHYIYIYALSASESFKSKTDQFAKTGSGQKRLRKDIELKFRVSQVSINLGNAAGGSGFDPESPIDTANMTECAVKAELAFTQGTETKYSEIPTAEKTLTLSKSLLEKYSKYIGI